MRKIRNFYSHYAFPSAATQSTKALESELCAIDNSGPISETTSGSDSTFKAPGSSLSRAKLLNYSASAAFWASNQSESSLTGMPSCYYLTNSPDTSQVAETAERKVSLHFFNKMKHLEKSHLEFGNRMEVMHSIFSEPLASNSYAVCDALDRVIASDAKAISDEAKAAAIRYLGIYQSNVSNSELTSLFIKSLSSVSEVQATAAARSLSDMGDRGAIPAITKVSKKIKNTRVLNELKKTIQSIEHANDSGSPA